MKKIELLKVNQNENTFYLMSYEPKEILKYTTIPSVKTPQNEMPLDSEKANQISEYIKKKGIVPNCPILNLKESNYIEEMDGKVYLNLPEPTQESKGTFDIVDGLTRMFALDKLNTNEELHVKYQMGFVVFDNLSVKKMREIVLLPSESKKGTDKTVVRNNLKWLHLLSENEEEIDKLIIQLNEEENPLKKRVSITGEKINNGYTLDKLRKIFEKAQILEPLKDATFEQKVKTLSNYLLAWDEVFPNQLGHQKELFGKLSGIRYMFFLFAFTIDILRIQRKRATKDNFVAILEILKKDKLTADFFNDENKKISIFKFETSTIALARKHGNYLVDTFVSKEADFSLF